MKINNLAFISFPKADYDLGEQVMERMFADDPDDECSTTDCDSDLEPEDELAEQEGGERRTGQNCELYTSREEVESRNFVYNNGTDCVGIESVGGNTSSDESSPEDEEFDDTEEDQAQLKKIVDDAQTEMTKRCIPAAYATADGLYRVDKNAPTDRRALFDVIIGRGKVQRKNIGNQLLLEHIQEMKVIWHNIWTRDRQEYAARMVQWVYRRGGRFFKHDATNGTFELVQDIDACKEVNHILMTDREVRRKVIIPSKRGGWIMKNAPSNAAREEMQRKSVGLLDAALVMAYNDEENRFLADKKTRTTGLDSDSEHSEPIVEEIKLEPIEST
mmetsp:Transcript_10646/g.30410  ORF Transcript_10646/g.30410 Transcript_10646/m.30410 type:complete len:331 (-) Transcript_10646:810-1802(-)|eukprot:CAMPEP_0119570448 /NCGR_PEP_ID=MMETSP1352-20130426/43619_1 /TAXON_ID=265584 /ORGANISM="Stauroneis constricta, Strain CCMP1120" /LENGTH=330 /DNA_ID=CAMNT_0007620117 /DNA_START=180 /DNA_END=1172 /DNA_ORIENTATION=+